MFPQLSFKRFLIEASSGEAKWEKYFADGAVDTIAKNDAPLFDVFEKPVKRTVSKGDKIRVLASDSYKPKLRVQIDDAEYLMKLSDIEKPFKAEREVGTDLKPDQLGLFGAVTIAQLGKKIKDAIDSHTSIPEQHALYLKALVDLAQNPDDQDTIEQVQDLYVMSGAAEDSAFRNTVNNDFMECLGPFFVVNEKPQYAAGGCKFPELGNEPLYDFTMKAERGENARIDSFSSKRSGGNTNTLKVTEVLKAAESDSKLQRKYKLELELLRIIADTPVKAAPDKINEFLAKNFATYKKAPATTDNTTIARLEAAVAKWINEESDLEFTPLVQNAIPDLWYVKSRLNSDGTIKVEPLKAGRDIEVAKLRSKSSPGHLTDKLGFAM